MRCMILVALTMSICGCSFECEPVPSVTFAQVEQWPLETEPPGGTPGIDYGSIWCLKEAFRQDGLVFAVFWFDDWWGSNGGSGGHSSNDCQQSEAQYSLTLGSGEESRTNVSIAYLKLAQKVKPAELTIQGESFDLRNGNLFLISTRGDTVKVRQTKRDIGLKGMRFDVESIQETAKTDEEIREFFAVVSAKKPEQ